MVDLAGGGSGVDGVGVVGVFDGDGVVDELCYDEGSTMVSTVSSFSS
jgi:hypothetical protein